MTRLSTFLVIICEQSLHTVRCSSDFQSHGIITRSTFRKVIILLHVTHKAFHRFRYNMTIYIIVILRREICSYFTTFVFLEMALQTRCN
jgi:hypothetical protein